MADPSASLGTRLAVADVFTPELLAKLGTWAQQYPVKGDARADRIAAALRAAGIGLVDLDRQRCVIDERVYESALHRLHLAEQRAAEAEAQLAAFLAPAVTDVHPRDTDPKGALP